MGISYDPGTRAWNISYENADYPLFPIIQEENPILYVITETGEASYRPLVSADYLVNEIVIYDNSTQESIQRDTGIYIDSNTWVNYVVPEFNSLTENRESNARLNALYEQENTIPNARQRNPALGASLRSVQ